MDRFVLAILLACAVIGAGLVDGEAPGAVTPPVASNAATGFDEQISADAGNRSFASDETEKPDATTSDEDAHARIVSQILKRFSVRHTALPERERIRLAHVIVAEAALHDLDPDLVMAVIEVESAGYHLATSHVGAMGLMQLLPSTGKELAGKLEIEWKGPDTLFDPLINVRLGTAYLRELADRYDGNVSIALAAYNWGPGRIDRRIRRGASVPKLYIEQVRRAIDRYADNTPTRS